MIGQKVQVIFQEEVISGKAIDLDNDGSLILLAEDGKKIKASAGDATIMR